MEIKKTWERALWCLEGSRQEGPGIDHAIHWCKYLMSKGVEPPFDMIVGEAGTFIEWREGTMTYELEFNGRGAWVNLVSGTRFMSIYGISVNPEDPIRADTLDKILALTAKED